MHTCTWYAWQAHVCCSCTATDMWFHKSSAACLPMKQSCMMIILRPVHNVQVHVLRPRTCLTLKCCISSHLRGLCRLISKAESNDTLLHSSLQKQMVLQRVQVPDQLDIGMHEHGTHLMFHLQCPLHCPNMDGMHSNSTCICGRHNENEKPNPIFI